MFGSNRPVQHDRTEEYSFLGFLSKSALTRVFTSQIEVFSVKPAFHFSFVINSFHNDLFSEGVPRGFFYFRKRHSFIFGRTTSDDNRGIPGRGLFFLKTTRTLYFGTNLGDFWFLRRCKRRRKETEEGPTKYQPVMSDMDPFGDKKVLGTMDRVPRPSAVHWTAYRVPAVHGPRNP